MKNRLLNETNIRLIQHRMRSFFFQMEIIKSFDVPIETNQIELVRLVLIEREIYEKLLTKVLRRFLFVCFTLMMLLMIS